MQTARHWTADLGTEIASYQMTIGTIDLGSQSRTDEAEVYERKSIRPGWQS